MKISDEIALSARNLARRKGRTALTLIGVVIGTCMVVLMISLGIAQTQANDEMLAKLGRPDPDPGLWRRHGHRPRRPDPETGRRRH